MAGVNSCDDVGEVAVGAGKGATDSFDVHPAPVMTNIANSGEPIRKIAFDRNLRAMTNPVTACSG
jgi:hypothetical protein